MYLGSGVCDVQVMEGNVLDNLFFLVHVTLGQRHVLLSLQVKLCGKSVTATLSLQTQERGTCCKAALR